MGRWFRNRLVDSVLRVRDERHPVDLDAEGQSDLLGDAHAAKARIAPLQFNDGRDELRRRTLRAGFAATAAGGKEQTIFAIDQCLVELEQRCRFDERADLRNPGADSPTAWSVRLSRDRGW